MRASDAQGQTPLHHAASNGHARVVHALLEFGGDVGATDLEGRTARDLATSKDSLHANVRRNLDRAGDIYANKLEARKSARAVKKAAELRAKTKRAAPDEL